MKNKKMLTAIVILMAIIGVLLIVLVNLQSKLDEAKEESESTTEKEVVVLNDNVEEDTEKSSEENNSIDNDYFDYNADIQKKVNDIDKLLTIDGTSYGIPCKFSEIKDKFTYAEEVPDTLDANGYVELHALKDGVDTGLTLMVINPSDKGASINDLYIQTIQLTEKPSPANISIGNLKIGAQLGDIEEFIKNGGYEYDVTESDIEKLFRIQIEGESVSLILVYDDGDEYVYKMILEYVIS